MVKLNRLFFCFILCSISLFAFSNSLSNWYIAGDIGIANLTDKESTPAPSPALHRLGATGLIGGGFIGYDLFLNESYKMGFEGFIDAYALNAASYQYYPNQNGISPTYQVRMKYDLGFRFLPNYALTPKNNIFLILGYSNAKFNIQDNGNYGFISSNTYKNGFQYGAGIQTELKKNIALRMNVFYTMYSTSNLTGLTVNSQGNPGSSSIVYTNSFSNLIATLSILYHFKD